MKTILALTLAALVTAACQPPPEGPDDEDDYATVTIVIVIQDVDATVPTSDGGCAPTGCR